MSTSAARHRIVTAVHLLLAFAFLHGLSPVAVSAQELTTLPQIRVVSSDPRATFNNIELCAGPAVAGCRDHMAGNNLVFGAVLEERGAQRLRLNDTGNLRGSATFLLYIQGMPRVGYRLEVTVETGIPVSIVTPASGRIVASGATASVNGVRVLQGQLFSLIPDVPAVIDLDVSKLWDFAHANEFADVQTPYPQPDVPGIGITVRRIQ